MSNLLMSQHVAGSPEQVFAAATNFGHAADFISGIEKVEMLSDGEVGVGTRFRETRKMFGKEAVEEMEVTAFEPAKSYTLACDSCGCAFQTEVRVKPDGSGTLIEMETNSRPVTLMAKLMSPLGFLTKGLMKKCLAKDLEDIKLAVEGGAVTTAPA